MRKRLEYESGIDADNHIWAQFWEKRDCLPFDYICELDAKCRKNFPMAEIVSIKRKPYVGKPQRAWWEVKWIQNVPKAN